MSERAAAARPQEVKRAAIVSNSERVARMRVWKTRMIALAVLVLLDATFDLYFWKVPRLSDSGDRSYDFLMTMHRLRQPKPEGTARIVEFGSSVSNSLDVHQVETLLQTHWPSPPAEIHHLLKPAMKASDYRTFFRAERDRIHPDVAVYIFNIVDFLNASTNVGVNPAVQDVLPPWTTLVERHQNIERLGDKLGLLAASVSKLYRYRKALRSCIDDHAELAWQWLRSKSPETYGFYRDGYTHHRFGFPVDGGRDVELEYYIHPAWIEQRGQVRLRFSLGGRKLGEVLETGPGWHTVRFDRNGLRGRVLDVTVDSGWSPRAAGISDDPRILGVRLREPPPASRNGVAPPLRYPPIDEGYIRPFLRMGPATGAEYERRWEQQLDADTLFGVEFRTYREERLRLRDKPFEVRDEFAAMEGLVTDLLAGGASVVLINAPESPMIGDYQEGPFYQGYLTFLRGLERRYDRVRFYDLRHALPREDFNDWHHPTYIGRIKLGPRYAEILAEGMRLVSLTPEPSH
jgi:hypothetical protein